MRKFISVEAAGFLLGLLVAFQALHKAQRIDDYDPSGQISLALTIIAGGWIAPTRTVDRRIADVAERAGDRPIPGLPPDDA